MGTENKFQRTVPFWAITQLVMTIPYRCFGSTYRSHLQRQTLFDQWRWDRWVVPKTSVRIYPTCCVIAQNSSVLVYFETKDGIHTNYISVSSVHRASISYGDTMRSDEILILLIFTWVFRDLTDVLWFSSVLPRGVSSFHVPSNLLFADT
jgi:hypothetical protein